MKRTPLKRTPFKKKPYTWKKKKPSEKKGLFDHLKKESRVEEWNRIKEEITPYFIKYGIYNTCELKLPQICSGSYIGLTYAHSKKRNDIARDEPKRTEELKEVIRACVSCHDCIEYLPKLGDLSPSDRMYIIVKDCIDRRNKRLKISSIYA